jgi:Flp pilus assembly protein TadD
MRVLAGGALFVAAAVLTSCGTSPPAATETPRDVRERAYRANNVGVALLEQMAYSDAASAFRTALTTDPSLAIARLNLGIALYYDQDLDGALREETEAARLLPEAPQPPYVLGLVARAQGRSDEARTYFERVRQLAPGDVGVNINLAQLHLEGQRFGDAVATLRPVVSNEPNNVTAVYVLGLALTRSGDATEGQRFLDRAQELRRTNYAVTFGTGYLEQGRYAEAVASTGAEPELVDQTIPAARFSAEAIALGVSAAAPPDEPFDRSFAASQLGVEGARDLAASLGGAVTVLDADSDGDLDLVVASARGQQLLLQESNGQWADVTAGSGLESVPPGAVAIGVLSADYDNDGAEDEQVGRSSLYRNDGKGHFADVTTAAGLPAFGALPGAAAFVDVDHDGDTDLLIAGLADVAATRTGPGAGAAFPAAFAPAPLQLLRNNGNGTFTDITRAARLDRRGHAVALAPTDFDNDRDIDLLIVYYDGPPALFSNQRDGTFRDVAADVGLGAVAGAGAVVRAASVGDVNKDDWPDFVFATGAGAVVASSDARGRFTVSPVSGASSSIAAAQFLDYDLDGLLDLVTWSAEGPRVHRNMGRGWADVTGSALDSAAPAPARTTRRGFVAADLDQDGDIDLVNAAGGGAWVWRNSGEPRNRSLRIDLRGRVTNRAGIGAKVQVRAGSLSARLDTSAATPAVAPASVVVGLGARPGADVVRVLWPSGILQAEVAGGGPVAEVSATLPSPFMVEELDRKPSSCPFLFAWNGERFEFVTDFLGAGEMGYWEAPGVYNHPDPVEYVRIRHDQLRPSGNRFELRVTNELEEVLYLDHLQLLAIAHPADVRVYPNEGMTTPAKAERLHAVTGAVPPVRVTDEHGHDVTDRITQLDRRYPDDFTLARIRGYAAPHALTIDLGAAPVPRTLLLTGWTDYAFSSDNVAAHQAGLGLTEPLLEVRDARGQWRRAGVPVGIPVGRPQTIAIDLSHVLRAGEHELRLSTNMRIYWDQIEVATTLAADRFPPRVLEPVVATLRSRGFSAEVRPDGEEPPGYDYGRVTRESPWKTFAGRYTREGDVLALLSGSDDRFVVSKPGDEVALAFDAGALAPLPPGWVRTYLLRGDGYSKEMDLNSASPDAVEPMPFHAMSGYPYPSSERYPDTPEHRQYREQYNTRYVGRPVPLLKAGR